MYLLSKKELIKIITILLVGTVLSSCSKEDEPKKVENEEPLITKMTIDPFYPGPGPGDVKDLIFEYDHQNRLIKKSGGFSKLSSAGGDVDSFTNNLYTSFIYNGNKVTVERFSTLPHVTPSKNSNYYTLSNSNKIIQRDIPNRFNSEFDQIRLYTYAGNNLVEIETTYPKYPYQPNVPGDYILTNSEKFYYDSNNNLTKTEYVTKHNGIEEGEKIVRTFEDYDKSINPTKRFFLVDEYFNRSLSKNNFRKYTEIRSYDGMVTASIVRNWTFNYDANGNIIIN